MSSESQYKRSQSMFDGMADAPFSGLGRGTGMTLKEMLKRIKASEKRRGIGSQRWRLTQRINARCTGVPGQRQAPSLPGEDKLKVLKKKLGAGNHVKN